LLSSNISSRCPHNMVNFGLLAAEIVSLVWGTPALVVGVSQTAAFNRGRHLYSAGRPSGWALAHILVSVYFQLRRCFWLPWTLFNVRHDDRCRARIDLGLVC